MDTGSSVLSAGEFRVYFQLPIRHKGMFRSAGEMSCGDTAKAV